ncbi:MAG: transglutaminase domain-containing protein [Myxococcales bacterium]|nr:transglutaminase domain-containing protein [Myxococcales bacterium]
MTKLEIGAAHRVALTCTIVLPLLGVMTGSLHLFIASNLLLGSVLFALLVRPSRRRSREIFWAVQVLTVVLFVLQAVSMRTAQIDSVLSIVMLGIFHRAVLRGGQRDDMLIIAASTVLMTMATTITPGVAFLFLILCFVPAVLWTMLTSTILEQGRGAPHAQDRLARRPLPRSRTPISATGVAFMVVGYVAVSFLPRYNFSGALAMGAFARFAGVDDSMTLGFGGYDARGDGSVQVRVSLREGLTPADVQGLYVRLYALDTFDGKTFSAGAGPMIPDASRRARVEASDTTAVVRVNRLVGRREPHPVPLVGREFGGAVGLRTLSEGASGTWFSFVPQASLRFEYSLDLTKPFLRELDGDARLERFSILPPTVDPEVRSLAQRLVEGKSGFSEKTSAILRHFDDGYVYSLDPLPGTSSDPLRRFLFEAKAGHCELYAGALAVLLREAGIPARVATGFYGGWWNSAARELEFVSDDAHAWVEAFDPERGWIWLDATPPDLRTLRQGKPLAWLFDLYDALESVWYNWVVDYDESRRLRLMTALKDVVTPPDLGLGDWAWPKNASSIASDRRMLPVAVAVLVFLLAVVFLAIRARGSKDLGQRLRRAIEAAPHETLRRALVRLDPTIRTVAQEAVGLYEAHRFATDSDRPLRAEVVCALERLEQAGGKARSTARVDGLKSLGQLPG